MLPARIIKSEQTIEKHDWLFQEVIDQLEKDFGYPEVFDNQERIQNLEELYKEVLFEISRMAKSNPDAFYALLYKVDLNETKLRLEMESGQHNSLEEVTSVLVLERVIQKVITRNIYSKKIKS